MKLKYLLATGLAAGMLFSQNQNADASTTSVEDTYPVTWGEEVSASQIANLSENMLNELAEDEGEIVSISEEYSTLNTRYENTDLDQVMPLAMPVSDFKLTTVVQRIYDKDSKSYDNFRFAVEGTWIKNPTWEFTDTIAVAWSDEFTLYQDYARIYADGVNSGSTLGATRAKVDPEKGVAYDIDLKTGKRESGIILTAKVYKHNSTGTATVAGEYGHVEITGRDVSISFGGGREGASVNMSIGFGASLNMAKPDYASFTY